MGGNVKKTGNPWKGLQSYQENDIIFGRDEEIKTLYARILYNTQTVVYGKSGIGKSSIINAGIIPRAKHDEMLPIAIRLAHTTKNDQASTSPYIEQVFNRIKEEVQKVDGEIEEMVSHVPNHAETLWELMHRIKIWVGKDGNRKRLTPLLLFDQFEEIFTLEIDNKRVESFFAELADLLNEIKPTYLTLTENNGTAQDIPQKEEGREKTRNVFSRIANRKRNEAPDYIEKSEFHLVITLREDFLSYLERYTAYIPVMKQNRFPLLPLNEEQAAKIITEPIKDLIQPDVAEMIIQRVTGRNDFKLDGIPEIEVDAALLSLYMEQLYERKGEDNNIISSELVQFNDDIIKKFYENSIEGISEKTIDYLEDELITNANRRNNVARIDLISSGVSEDDLDKLIDKKVLRQFSYGGDLRIEFIHDILCPIVNDRIEHREQLAKEREATRRAEEEEARRKKEKAEEDARREKERLLQEEKLRKAEEEKQILLRKQQLQEEENRLLQRKQEEELIRAEREKQVQQEQLARAEEERQLLLKKQKLQEEENRLIQRQKEEENAKLRKETTRIKKRNRRRLYAAGAFVMFLLLGIFIYIWNFTWPHISYYAQFERVNGWPVGVGDKLSPEEMKQLPLYYKLSHEGRKDYDTDVEVCSSNGRLPRSPRIFCLEVCETDSDSRAKEYLNLLSQIKSIHFEAGEGDRLAKEVIKGENDSVLYYVNYFYLETEGQVWTQFVSSKGQAMSVRGNGLDRIKLSWYVSDDENDWRNGRVTSMIYYDAQGVHQNGANGVYGYQIEYSDDRQSTTLYSLDKFGLPFDAPFNAVTTTRRKENIETKYEHATCIPDSARTPARGPNGFWREVKEKNMFSYYNPGSDAPSAKCHITTDAYGNTKQMKMEGDVPHFQPTIIKYTYDERTGYCTSEEKLNANESPFYGSDSIYMKKWEYDDNGHVSLEEHYVTKDRIVYAHYITRKGNVVRDELRDVKNKEYPFIVRVDSVMDNYYSSSYYGKDNALINFKHDKEKVPYHRVVAELNGNQRTTKYFRYDSAAGKEQPQVVTKEDSIVVSFFCKKEEFDKDGNVMSSQIFDKDGNIVKSMLYYYQNGQNIGRAVRGIEGTPVRCDKWEEEGYRYYKFYYNKDFDDMYSGLTAVDEWGHRSSTWDGYDYLYLDWFHFKDKYVAIFKTYTDCYYNTNRMWSTKIFKKYDQIIFIPDPELTDLEVPYVHILSPDSKLYNNKKGLRDGDRIIRFGEWKLGQSQKLLLQEWNNLMEKGKTMHVEILRPDTDSHLYKQKVFDLSCSKDEERLIEFHVLKMTESEMTFIKKFLKK